MEPKKLFQGPTGLILAIGIGGLLLVGACGVCGGGLLAPFVFRVRQAEVQREEAVERLRQAGQALQKEAAPDSAVRQEPESAPGAEKKAAAEKRTEE
jgi:hypothetical protein